MKYYRPHSLLRMVWWAWAMTFCKTCPYADKDILQRLTHHNININNRARRNKRNRRGTIVGGFCTETQRPTGGLVRLTHHFMLLHPFAVGEILLVDEEETATTWSHHLLLLVCPPSGVDDVKLRRYAWGIQHPCCGYRPGRCVPAGFYGGILASPSHAAPIC